MNSIYELKIADRHNKVIFAACGLTSLMVRTELRNLKTRRPGAKQFIVVDEFTGLIVTNLFKS